MPKIYLTDRARQRLITDARVYRNEVKTAKSEDGKPQWVGMSDDLMNDIADFDRDQGQDIPPGTMPGPAVIQFQRCKLAFIVQPDDFIIDLSETIFAPKAGILRPV
jgi:hypothetical protein